MSELPAGLSQPIGQFRIAKDLGGDRARYEDVEVGRELGSVCLSFSQDDVDAMCSRFESFHPWYSVNSPFGGTVVPVACTFAVGRRLLSSAYNIVGLFYSWAFECSHALLVDTEYSFSATVADKWVNNDREYVAYEGTCRDAAGRIMFTTRRAHVLDYLKRSVPKVAEGGLESRPALVQHEPDAAAQRAPRPNAVTPTAAIDIAALATRDTRLGTWLPTHAKAMTEQVLDREALQGAAGVRHHSDAAARMEGLPKRFAGAPSVMELVHRSALSFFGAGWVEGGRADLTIVRPVFADEFVYSKAYVRGQEWLADGSIRLDCEAWVENQTGERKIVGTVSGVIR